MNVILKLYLVGHFVLALMVWPSNHSLVAATVARYDNYRLYKLIPNADRHLTLLKAIESNSDSYTFILGPRMVNGSVVVIVPPHKFADFDSMLNVKNIPYEIAANDVQSLIDDESLTQTRISESFGWNKYYPLEGIYKWIDSILGQYPNVTSPISIGKTYEGRDIRGVKISYKNGNPGIFIEGGIHAREWVSPAVATFLLNALLSSKDDSIRNIAENFDWYIVPNLNPDGYVYSHTSDRFWRKTRKPYGGNCFGADPNRNWDFHFGEFGVNSDPCSPSYPGLEPFSEIEMKSYADYVKSLKDKIHTFISFHSYSQLLLFPYGHTSAKAKNYDDLLDIGQKAASALARRYNTVYQVGNIYDTIYPASGSSMDWIYEIMSIPLTFTYELRPSQSYVGFDLPANEIIPAALETLDSIVALLNHAEYLGYYKMRESESKR